MSIEPVHSATADEGHAPCPTPLAWREVVDSVGEFGQVQTLHTDRADVELTSFGQGPTLLFLPGVLGSPRLYALVAWLLREEYRCLLVDFPRWHRLPSLNSFVQETAETVAQAVRQSSSDPVRIYASSAGCQVALSLMRQHPEQIEQAVLQSGWACRRLNLFETALLQLGRTVSWPVRRVPLWYAVQVQNHRPWFPPFDETRFGFLLDEIEQTPTCEGARRVLAAARTDLRGDLASITHPILVLRCEGDGPLVDEMQTELVSGLPNAQEEWLHSTGSYPYLTHPHRVVKILHTFFNCESPT